MIALGLPTDDARVPTLAMLLDDAATTQWLREHGGAAMSGATARVRYLRHKPGTSVQAWVEIARGDDGAGAREMSHAVVLGTAAHGEPKRAKLARTASRRDTWSVGDGSGTAGTVAVGHAADRPLLALAPLLREGATTLRHNPGRRWVGRAASGELLKVSAPGREATAVRAAALLAEHGVPTPRVLQHGDGLLRLEYRAGRTLETTIDGGGAPSSDVLVAFGHLVAALHAVPSPTAAGPDRVTSHGDLSPDQVLLQPDGALALLDLDRVTCAPPAADLGSVLGDVLARLSTVAAPGTEADAVAHRAWTLLLPVLEGYRAAGGVVADEDVVAAGALSLRGRAAEPWRRREHDAAGQVRRRRDLARLLPTLLAAPRRSGRSGSAPVARRPSAPPDRVVVDGVEHTVLRGWPRGLDRALLELGAPDGSRRGAEAALGGADGGDARVLVHPRGADPRLPAFADRLARGESVVVHRPGRRAVLRAEGPGAPYVKVTRRGRAAVAARRHRALAGVLGESARTAEVLWSSEDALATAPLPGVTLLDLGQDADVPTAALAAAWSGVGRVLRTLRARDVEESADLAAVATHDAEAEAATTLAWLDPALAWGLLPAVDPGEVRDALAPLVEGARDGAAEPGTLLHRDLHDQQVLVAPDGSLGLLDLDTVARGESALDLANLLAHLDLRQRQGLLTPERRRRAEEALLAGAAPGPRTLARTPAHLTVARLRLAGVYALRPRWRALAGELLLDTLR
ncbi:protein kinase family protein [Serinibacter arcticus]|uniref:Aminoglycoside phosphotransferase domain-containing protein n=1 Tax=Serinibacter arcticus TaxID=1655435 RepID=A0A4Z1E6T5_9MICO|nr:hypothetical protein [Serinibacter arcticus]TGO05397.1 hypothetical protein SERN_1401 [Serinibacter arcticus]